MSNNVDELKSCLISDRRAEKTAVSLTSIPKKVSDIKYVSGGITIEEYIVWLHGTTDMKESVERAIGVWRSKEPGYLYYAVRYLKYLEVVGASTARCLGEALEYTYRERVAMQAYEVKFDESDFGDEYLDNVHPRLKHRLALETAAPIKKNGVTASVSECVSYFMDELTDVVRSFCSRLYPNGYYNGKTIAGMIESLCPDIPREYREYSARVERENPATIVTEESHDVLYGRFVSEVKLAAGDFEVEPSDAERCDNVGEISAAFSFEYDVDVNGTHTIVSEKKIEYYSDGGECVATRDPPDRKIDEEGVYRFMFGGKYVEVTGDVLMTFMNDRLNYVKDNPCVWLCFSSFEKVLCRLARVDIDFAIALYVKALRLVIVYYMVKHPRRKKRMRIKTLRAVTFGNDVKLHDGPRPHVVRNRTKRDA